MRARHEYFQTRGAERGILYIIIINIDVLRVFLVAWLDSRMVKTVCICDIILVACHVILSGQMYEDEDSVYAANSNIGSRIKKYK